jgi:hypothetical protein
LGERRVRNAKVEGSIPFRSTINPFQGVSGKIAGSRKRDKSRTYLHSPSHRLSDQLCGGDLDDEFGSLLLDESGGVGAAPPELEPEPPVPGQSASGKEKRAERLAMIMSQTSGSSKLPPAQPPCTELHPSRKHSHVSQHNTGMNLLSVLR